MSTSSNIFGNITWDLKTQAVAGFAIAGFILTGPKLMVPFRAFYKYALRPRVDL